MPRKGGLFFEFLAHHPKKQREAQELEEGKIAVKKNVAHSAVDGVLLSSFLSASPDSAAWVYRGPEYFRLSSCEFQGF